MKKDTYIFIIICLSIFIYFFYFDKKEKGEVSVSNTVETEWGSPEVVQKEAEIVAENLPQVGLTYKDNLLGIVFSYPEKFKISAFNEEEEYVVVLQDVSKKVGVQFSGILFSDPFTSLTEERIESDLGIVIQNYRVIKIGKNNNIDAITFLTGDNVLFRETWFVNGPYLVQVKGYQSSEPLMIAILKTLEM